MRDACNACIIFGSYIVHSGEHEHGPCVHVLGSRRTVFGQISHDQCKWICRVCCLAKWRISNAERTYAHIKFYGQNLNNLLRIYGVILFFFFAPQIIHFNEHNECSIILK